MGGGRLGRCKQAHAGGCEDSELWRVGFLCAVVAVFFFRILLGRQKGTARGRLIGALAREDRPRHRQFLSACVDDQRACSQVKIVSFCGRNLDSLSAGACPVLCPLRWETEAPGGVVFIHPLVPTFHIAARHTHTHTHTQTRATHPRPAAPCPPPPPPLPPLPWGPKHGTATATRTPPPSWSFVSVSPKTIRGEKGNV